MNIIAQKDIVRILNPLFSTEEYKPLQTVAVSPNPMEYNFIIVDFVDWLRAVASTNITMKNVEKTVVEEFVKEYQTQLFMISLNGTVEDIERRIPNYSDKFLEDVKKMYSYFSSYIRMCQFKMFDIYTTNGKTNPVPLIPFSFALNRLVSKSYMIEEVKPTWDEETNLYITEYGNNSTFIFREVDKLDDVSRARTDLGFRAYHTEFSFKDNSPLPKEWFDVIDKIDPKLKTYWSRVNMIKKLFAQYVFTGQQRIDDLEGQDKQLFFINYPMYTIGAVENNAEIMSEKEITYSFK